MHTPDIFDDTNIHVSSFANTSFLNTGSILMPDKKKEKKKEEKPISKEDKKHKEGIKVNNSPDPLKPAYNP